jgi:CheY-like chemotaxis protein
MRDANDTQPRNARRPASVPANEEASSAAPADGPGPTLADGSGPVEGSAAPLVLVVDDADDLRAAMCEWLSHHGYRVAPAAHGQEALAAVLSGPLPSVIILDLHMPVMSGWEFLGVVRSYSRLMHIPVVVISGSDHLVSELRPNMTVLRKPFDGERLISSVGRFAPRPHP